MTEPLRSESAARYRVQSAERAIAVLESISTADRSGRSLAEVAATLGVARSTAHALLRTLEAHGIVTETTGPRFLLGTSLIRLGDLASAQVPLAELGRPLLRALSEETGLTSRLAASDDGYPLFIARVDGPGSVRFRTPLGSRELPHTSAAGKAILAQLPTDTVRQIAGAVGMVASTRRTITDVEDLLRDLDRVRTRGFAIDDEEDTEGILCVGAAVYDASGRCVGAISTTGIKIEGPALRIEELGKTVRKHADALSERLGYRATLGR